jgi:isoquinoline 1-oxidoreductase beta subunit
MKALELLRPEWRGGHAGLDEADLRADLAEGSAAAAPTFASTSEGFQSVMDGADRRLLAAYHLPFLAHAPMEPVNAVVRVNVDRCDIWLGTQAPARVQAAAVQVTGLPPEAIHVHNQLVGGGFGRRADATYVRHAVQIAQAVPGVAVKVLWTREEDMRASSLRPMMRHDVSIGVGTDGHPVAWRHRITGGSVFGQHLPERTGPDRPDPTVVEGARELIYSVGPTQLEYVRRDPPLPLAWWRSTGPGHNMFVVEGVIDELAAAAGVDPVAYRRSIIRDARARRVLDTVAGRAGWASPLPERTGRGIAVQHAFGSYIGCVVEARVGRSGDIRLSRVVIAFDCGRSINPDAVAAQLEGGAIYGLSAALWGRVSFTDGRIDQSNFNTYRVLRIDETPPIELHFVDSGDEPGGAGEAGTSVVFPALAAAIFDATGVRLRSLPFDRHADLLASDGGDRAGRAARTGTIGAASFRVGKALLKGRPES